MSPGMAILMGLKGFGDLLTTGQQAGNVEQMNQWRKDAVKRVEGVPDYVRDKTTDQADRLTQNLARINSQSYGEQKGNLMGLTQGLFGTNNIRGVDPVNQGALTKKTTAREQARDAEVQSRLSTLAATQTADYKKLTAAFDTNLKAVRDQGTQAVADMKALRSEDLGALQLDAAYQLAGQNSQLWTDLETTKSGIRQRYLDSGADLNNPDVKRMMDQEMQQADSKGRFDILANTKNVETTNTQIQATLRANYANAIAGVHQTAIGANAQATSSYMAARDSAFSAHYGLLGDIEKMSQASKNFASSQLQAAEMVDTQNYKELVNGFNALEEGRKADETFRETSYTNIVNGAWATYGSMEYATAQVMTGTMLTAVDWGQAASGMLDSVNSWQQTRLQQDAIDAQNRATNMGFISSLMPNVGLNVTKKI